MPVVTIIDYGIGNILSVSRAFEYCGAKVILSGEPENIMKADFLVLPGVGAFADGMKGLLERGLVQAIKEFAGTGNPFMGICLGMQMMMEESEEFGMHEGLGLIPGKVVLIEKTTVEDVAQKIPHIGWNELRIPEGNSSSWWSNTIMSGISETESTYFVHSYTAVPDDGRNRLADAFYGGRKISAAIRKENVYGCQFHPEKSGNVGLKIIDNFLKLK